MTLTLKEIRARQETPYKYEAPYYSHPVNGYDKYNSGVYSKSYYDVHGGNFEEDVRAYIAQLPDKLQTWILQRIDNGVEEALESGNLISVSNVAVLAYIDMAHFFYYGIFAE